MNYFLNKVLTNQTFDNAVEQTTSALKREGFGILNTIDMQSTLKQKIDVDIKRYLILGACNPGFAHKALQAESKIGVLLPCSVVVRETDNQSIEVAIVNPEMFGQAINNSELDELMTALKQKLRNVIEHI